MGSSRAELRELGSRFFAFVEPAPTNEAAQAAVERLRREFPDATHHCFAWRVGWPPAERAGDDGEPSGTAGQPILRVLSGAGLTDLVAVVVRWFGGTKLGKGGLARAYGGATAAALAGLATREVRATEELVLRLPYESVGAVKRLVRPPEVTLLEERYGADVELRLAVVEEEAEAFRATLAELRVVVDGGA